ncbi:peptidase M48 [Altererythrobacter sp. B11]|uniref:M48 family metalloprotease n=1 Tax=Altererythrobacter sp. B11 TaxID=2060312 RepID=UPI000DC6FFF0|nr:M48 family metalloprotease [Altererythrobacter sp. B11]BBC72862.1 peptidase M48 [Altererythrobacter sp. B11]
MTAIRPFLSRALFAGCAAGALGACATVPGAGIAPGTPITPAEAQQGAQYHEQFVREFGGEVSGPQADYVASVGQKIAVQSGLATTPGAFDVTLLDSSVNNAFAVPGGYVYVTRQLVTLMNNEAELAGVLGHEVGHVSARHSARRQQAAQRNQLLGVLGSVLSGVLLGDSALGDLGQRVASTAPQLATLSYSRSQELEADDLGVQYLESAGYDPHAMATVLASLAAQNSLDAQLQGQGDATVPQWASTHPDPASRVQNALQLAGNRTGATNADVFLTRIDGLVYGDSPKQGVIEGRSFIHPVLRLSFTAPDGFYMVNGSDAVSISGSGGQAQMSGGSYSGNLETYVRQQFQALGGQNSTLAPQEMKRTTINGLPAVYGTARVTSSGNQVDVAVFAYEFSNTQAFHFTAIAPAGQIGMFNPMFQSMRRISTAEAGQVVPRRIDVVTAGRGDSVRSLAAKMAYTDAQEARFRVLNGLSSSDQVVPGRKYKIVIRSN